MLQFLSKALTLSSKASRLPIQSASLTADFALKTLYYNPYNSIHSQQKVLVKYENEFRPLVINNLWDNDGARRRAKILGRGPGSGKGKTAGRGHKGQRSRSGGSLHPSFEGGQTPLADRLPKWGMTRRNNQRYDYINLDKIIYLVKHGRLDHTRTITIKDLYDTGAFRRIRYGVKVLGRGADQLDFSLDLEVSDASKETIEAIKNKGGSVKCIYRTKLKLKEHIKPYMFKFALDEPLPTVKTVENLERIKERGAEVVYNVPDWKKAELETASKAEKELKEAEFEFPVKRHEGMGAKTVRTRKPPLQKFIDLGLNK